MTPPHPWRDGPAAAAAPAVVSLTAVILGVVVAGALNHSKMGDETPTYVDCKD